MRNYVIHKLLSAQRNNNRKIMIMSNNNSVNFLLNDLQLNNNKNKNISLLEKLTIIIIKIATSKC